MVWGSEEGGQGRASLLDVVGGVPVRRLQENTNAERKGRIGSTIFVLGQMRRRRETRGRTDVMTAPPGLGAVGVGVPPPPAVVLPVAPPGLTCVGAGPPAIVVVDDPPPLSSLLLPPTTPPTTPPTIAPMTRNATTPQTILHLVCLYQGFRRTPGVPTPRRGEVDVLGSTSACCASSPPASPARDSSSAIGLETTLSEEEETWCPCGGVGV